MAAAITLLLGVLATSVCAENMKQIPLKSITALSAVGAVNSALLDRCNGKTFAGIDVFGTEILDVIASPVQNYSTTYMDQTYTGLNFCNITMTYTHPGRGDKVNVFATLPLNAWNGRFQGRGGGGFITGVDAAVLAPVTAQGFAAASTDGGHTLYEQSAESWALNSPGNINWNLLEDYAYKSLGDMTLIGQQLTTQFFSSPPKHSYWTGCSTGGRQGLVFAQRYPDLYDGILALAPAINLEGFVVAEYYPQHVMNRMGHYPLPCELNAIADAAVKACDRDDGVEDGVISLPSICKFDTETLVGKEFDCNGEKGTFSKEGAVVAKAFWQGPVNPADPAKWYWYGVNHGTPFNGMVGTTCANSSASSCSGFPFVVAEEYIRLFQQKDPAFVTTNMTDEEYFSMFHRSAQEYGSMLSTSDPDLSLFKAHGGKMITWHGLADELIPVNGSSKYYKEVMDLDKDVAEYYRYFEAPGVYHCFGGPGPRPEEDETLAALMAWVENGTVPETLTARSQTGDGAVRELCLYPQTLVYVGGEPEQSESWVCR